VAVALDDATVAFRVAGGIGSTQPWSGPICPVAHGEFVAIVGPTGCGKSTLLNVAAGLLKPAAGSVKIFGQPLTGVEPGTPAICFQADALFPMEDRDRQCRHWPRHQGRAARAVAAAGAGLAHVQWASVRSPTAIRTCCPAGSASASASHKVLIRDPKILLMDEPFGPARRPDRQIMGNLLLELWNADRKAVLFVTHDLEEAIVARRSRRDHVGRSLGAHHSATGG